MTKTKLIKTASGMEVEQDGKSYPVRSEDEIKLAALAFELYKGDKTYTDWPEKALSQGIEIPNERIYINKCKCKESGESLCEPFNERICEYATLLTEDKEGEGQGDLWDELFDHIENTPVDVPWADCIKELKQKFKITKK